MGPWELGTVILAGIATLAIFSFLIRENPLYRFFEHLFIGIAAGLGVILSIKNFLWPHILEPMLGWDIVVYPDGTLSHEYEPLLLLYLLPMSFGLLYYCLYSRRWGWLAKLVIGFQLGVGGGLAFKAFYNRTLPQLTGSFKPLVVFENGQIQYWASLENIFFIFTLLAVMYYFFCSFQRRSLTAERVAVSGRWLLMVCFGAFFGSTVMARLALLVERVQFLLMDWRLALVQLWTGGWG